MQLNDHRSAQQLQDAFETFNQVSLALESSYRELELQAAELTRELAATRSERMVLADRLEQLIAALPAGVLVLDANGIIRQVNQTAIELLGEPLLGQLWKNITERAFATNQTGTHEVHLKDGRWLNLASRHLESDSGRILLLNDVTENRMLLETVNRQQRLSAMGEMVASLAHQIRTPLSTALLYASQLGHNDMPLETQTRFSSKLVERLRHLERMVNDMLLFARGGNVEQSEMTIEDLVNDIEQTLEADLKSSNASWRVIIDAEAASLCGNQQALVGAFGNLVTNAIQAAGSNAEVTLQVSELSDGQLEFRISDNGPGIPAELHDQLFDPFFTTRPDGTGLGLAVVQATVRAHKGTLRIESEAGQGATFIITLPPNKLTGALSSNRADAELAAIRHDFKQAV